MKKWQKLALLILITALITVIYIKFESISVKVDDFSRQTEKIVSTIAPKPTTIDPNGMPDRYLIETTFVPQSPEKKWDQPWQDACEEAALLTSVYYLKNQNPSTLEIRDELLSVFEYETALGWGHDINISQMAQMAKDKYNIESVIIENPDVEKIKSYLVSGYPVIITANGKILFQENKHFKDKGPYYHALVILGYDEKIHKFVVHDVGTQFGAYFKYSYKLLLDSIHDYPLSGNKQDINQGDKKALILLK